MHFRLNIKPLGVNSIYQGRRFRTPRYDAYEKECLLKMPAKKIKLSDMIRVDMIFGFSSKLADIDGPIKAIMDICQKKYGFNDRHVFELEVHKKIVPKGKEFIFVNISNCLPFG